MPAAFVAQRGGATGGYLSFPPYGCGCSGVVTVGNILYVVAAGNNNAATGGSCTDNLGNTYTVLGRRIQNNSQQLVYAAPVTVGGTITSVSVNQGSGLSIAPTIGVAEFSGVDTFQLYEAADDVGSPGTGSTITVTTSAAGLQLHIVGIGSGGTQMTGYTQPSGYTNGFIAGDGSGQFAKYYAVLNYLIGPTSGTLTDSWTGSEDWTVSHIYYKAAAPMAHLLAILGVGT